MVQLNARIPASLREDLDAFCTGTHRSPPAVVRFALQQLLHVNGKLDGARANRLMTDFENVDDERSQAERDADRLLGTEPQPRRRHGRKQG